jgi:hypothetical protein
VALLRRLLGLSAARANLAAIDGAERSAPFFFFPQLTHNSRFTVVMREKFATVARSRRRILCIVTSLLAKLTERFGCR